jgi:hypothetical protein
MGHKPRTAERFLCDQLHATRLLMKPGFRCIPVAVADVSARGAQLCSLVPIPAESNVAIDWCFDDPVIQRNVLARVVHCSLRPDQKWHVGCEFRDELSPDELAPLLESN